MSVGRWVLVRFLLLLLLLLYRHTIARYWPRCGDYRPIGLSSYRPIAPRPPFRPNTQANTISLPGIRSWEANRAERVTFGPERPTPVR